MPVTITKKELEAGEVNMTALPPVATGAGGAVGNDVAKLTRKIAQHVDGDALQGVVTMAAREKPSGYDVHYGQMRQYLDGNVLDVLMEDLGRRFPNTADELDPLALNVIGHHASLAAQVWREPADRWIEVGGLRPGALVVDDDGADAVVLPGELARQNAFRDMLVSCSLTEGLRLAEAKLRGLHTIFFAARWDADGVDFGVPAHLRLDLHYPASVFVVEHPLHPGALWPARAVLIEIARPGASGRWFKVWSRREDFGEWFVSEQSTDGEATRSPTPYGSRFLPIVVAHNGDCDRIYCDRDRYLIKVQQAVNALLTDFLHGGKLQGHGVMWAAGPDVDRLKGSSLVIGPGRVNTYPAGTQVGAVDFGFDLTMLNAAEQILKAVGFTTRQLPDAWSTKPGNPPSGTSRELANIPADERRAEDVGQAKVFEERDLLPMLARVYDRFAGAPVKIGGENVTYHVQHPQPRRYVEPRAQVDMAAAMQANGWISEAEAAVRGGAWRTLDEAIAAGLSPTIQKAARAPDEVLPALQADPPPPTE